MSIFGSIFEKLGISSAAADEVIEQAASVPPVEEVSAAPIVVSANAVEVDVMAQLADMAADHAEKLNWKTSIVDLLKLLKLDSSLTSRKELAAELGCPAGKMGDSAQMNMWLHKTVLRKLAENGGNIPPDLLD
jgi:hypothetical protein